MQMNRKYMNEIYNVFIADLSRNNFIFSFQKE